MIPLLFRLAGKAAKYNIFAASARKKSMSLA
jgi:hypothetical protein